MLRTVFALLLLALRGANATDNGAACGLTTVWTNSKVERNCPNEVGSGGCVFVESVAEVTAVTADPLPTCIMAPATLTKMDDENNFSDSSIDSAIVALKTSSAAACAGTIAGCAKI